MPTKFDDTKQLRCSFCGKTQDQVKRLIAGPNVYICDECIELCSEIIEEEQRQQERRDDIAKFTKLAMSDIENESHNKLVEDLFSNGNVTDLFEDEVISSLATNQELLNDLGLL